MSDGGGSKRFGLYGAAAAAAETGDETALPGVENPLRVDSPFVVSVPAQGVAAVAAAGGRALERQDLAHGGLWPGSCCGKHSIKYPLYLPM